MRLKHGTLWELKFFGSVPNIEERKLGEKRVRAGKGLPTD
jgi:hypothetical protein